MTDTIYTSLDVDKFLTELYILNDKKNNARTLDHILEYCFDAGNFLSDMKTLYEKIDITVLPVSAMLSLLTCTFKYSNKFPEHLDFYNKCFEESKTRGKPLDDIEKSFKGLKEEGNFWKRMENYGAVGDMFGIKPK